MASRRASLSTVPDPRFRALFVDTWTEIRQAIERNASIGVVVAAVDAQSRRLATCVHASAEVGMPAAAIIGSHPACDLWLHHDATISLRHLALLLLPLRAGSGGRGPRVAFRVLDLRTDAGFTDELGRRLESVTADGPAFLAIGRSVLFIIPVDDEPDWPDDGADAWDCFPERLYLDEQERSRRRRSFRPPSEPDQERAPRASEIWTRAGPARATWVPANEGDRVIGDLTVITSDASSRQRIAVGQHAAEDGILIGRFDRCDTHGSDIMRDPGISRVHVLILAIDGDLYAIDVSSTNGSFGIAADGDLRRVRIVEMTSRRDLVLGDDLARIQWSPRPDPEAGA